MMWREAKAGGRQIMEFQRTIILTEAGISDEMLVTEECVDSTNLLARKLAADGAASFTAVIAGSQTAGRGRLGRTFYSPEDSGLYLSLIVQGGELPGSEEIESVCSKLTVAAGACVAQSIDELFGTNTRIKWVNDIIIDGRKAGGILTEGRIEGGALAFAIIGIGVNISLPGGGFPDDISDIAGAVRNAPLQLNAGTLTGSGSGSAAASYPREMLAGRIIRKLSALLRALSENEKSAAEALYDDYLKRVNWMFGKELAVKNTAGQTLFTAMAEGLKRDFGLIVKTRSGDTVVLSTGEVSVRLTE